MKRIKNKICIIGILAIFATTICKAQNADRDSIFVHLDSTNVNVINELQSKYIGGKININQSNEISKALSTHRENNLANQKLNGWRLVIYKGNKQNSREVSTQVKLNFNSKYPDIPSYRSYVVPDFYVFVGDFRTKEEAEKFRYQIKDLYPTAWIKEEKINLPPL